QARRSIGFLSQGQVTEPGRPVLVQVPLNPKVVHGGNMSLGRGRHEGRTFAVALMLRRLIALRVLARRRAGRRMTYSAPGGLMAHTARKQGAGLSSLGPR